jgi:hypothetical protein
MGQTDGEVLGLPAAGDADRWIPIKGPHGDTGLYLVMRSAGGRLHVGVGWKWSVTVTADGLVVSICAHVPLLSTDGTGNGTCVDIATAEAPLRLAAEVTLRDGFHTVGLGFQGLRGSITLTGVTEPPGVALVLLGLQLPGETAPRDRSLADLSNLPGSAWIETAVALFAAQLAAAGASGAVGASKAAAVVNHLLPLLGITAPAGKPRLRWEDLPARGGAVFDEWFLALVTVPEAMKAWLGCWEGLLGEGAGTLISGGLSAERSGTRADPWWVGMSVAGVDTAITAAIETQASGTRLLYLGLRVGVAEPITLAG